MAGYVAGGIVLRSPAAADAVRGPASSAVAAARVIASAPSARPVVAAFLPAWKNIGDRRVAYGPRGRRSSRAPGRDGDLYSRPPSEAAQGIPRIARWGLDVRDSVDCSGGRVAAALLLRAGAQRAQRRADRPRVRTAAGRWRRAGQQPQLRVRLLSESQGARDYRRTRAAQERLPKPLGVEAVQDRHGCELRQRRPGRRTRSR